MRSKWRTYIICSLLAFSSSLIAQPHYISVGVRGGAGTFRATGALKNQWEPNVWVDANYSYLWPVQETQLGITTGLNFGYVGGGYTTSYTDQYTNFDYYGNAIDYTNTVGSIEERTHGFAMEIPALFALHYKGLIMHAGIKLQVPCWYKYTQTISDINIHADYPAFGVALDNELITGKLPQEQYVTEAEWRDVGDVSLLLSVDLGYEWQLTERDWLGLQAWFDGAPYSHPAGKPTERMIDVAPISDPTYPPAQVTVNTAISTTATRLNYLACGIKLSYRFDVLGHMQQRQPQ